MILSQCRDIMFSCKPCLYMKGLLFSASMLLFGSISAQPKVEIPTIGKAMEYRSLVIGDEIPNLALELVNYKREKVFLSEFRGKALIIDFWATWCAPCVASFTKLDSLKNSFKDELEIIPVTYEKKEKVAPFLDNINKTRNINVYSVVNNIELKKFFPHTSVPHYVLIDRDGIVKAITFSEDITANNIRQLIEKKELNLPLKFEEPLNKQNPLAVHTTDKNILLYHVLSKYIPGVPTGIGPLTDTSFSIDNGSLLNLYQVAYGEGIRLIDGFKHINLLTLDSTRFTDFAGPGLTSSEYRGRWIREHGLNYSIKVAPQDSARKWEIMRQDLAQCFPEIKAQFIKAQRKCLILSKLNNAEVFKSNSTEAFSYDRTLFNIRVTNGSMRLLINLFNHNFQNSYYTIIDKTNFKGLINVNVEADFSKLENINKALEKYGLVLEEEMKTVEILQVSDLKTGSHYISKN